MPILNLYKPMSWTPLQAIEAYKQLHPEVVAVPMVYAGRLDPMASGVLPVLSGEERHQLPAFLMSTKTYQATVLFGYISDTYDVLGRVQATGVGVDTEGAHHGLFDLKGTRSLPLPPYSAYKVQGKALHTWAREGRLNEIEVPMRDMEALDVRDVAFEGRDAHEVLTEIVDRVKAVQGDFRQIETIDDWERLLENQNEPLMTATFTLDVTSGTYVRALVHALGGYLGCGALLLNLHRTRAGEMRVEDSGHLDA